MQWQEPSIGGLLSIIGACDGQREVRRRSMPDDEPLRVNGDVIEKEIRAQMERHRMKRRRRAAE